MQRPNEQWQRLTIWSINQKYIRLMYARPPLIVAGWQGGWRRIGNTEIVRKKKRKTRGALFRFPLLSNFLCPHFLVFLFLSLSISWFVAKVTTILTFTWVKPDCEDIWRLDVHCSCTLLGTRYYQVWSLLAMQYAYILGRSEKPKSWKTKNGQADYLPRHSPDVRTVFEI